MSLRAKIIGIGQDTAGDDGIGIAVARRLRQMHLPDGLEVIERAEPSAAISHLTGSCERVVLIDAVIDGGSSGRILQIEPSQSAASNVQMLSTHGIGLMETIELARTLDEGAMPREIKIVGVTIERPTCYRAELSANVAAAILPAAELALSLATA
jgi:hydrogenase maturation protease